MVSLKEWAEGTKHLYDDVPAEDCRAFVEAMQDEQTREAAVEVLMETYSRGIVEPRWGCRS
jgi:hypothetical protein